METEYGAVSLTKNSVSSDELWILGLKSSNVSFQTYQLSWNFFDALLRQGWCWTKSTLRTFRHIVAYSLSSCRFALYETKAFWWVRVFPSFIQFFLLPVVYYAERTSLGFVLKRESWYNLNCHDLYDSLGCMSVGLPSEPLLDSSWIREGWH